MSVSNLKQNFFFFISACAFVLLQTTSPVGGIFSAIAIVYLFVMACKHEQWFRGNAEGKRSIAVAVFTLLFLAVPCIEFYSRWSSSGKLEPILSRIGINGSLFIGGLVLIAGVCSAYFVYHAVCRLVYGAADAKGFTANGCREISAVRAGLFILLAAVIFQLGTSYFSPLADRIQNTGGDLTVFYLLGKSWSQGLIPYVDVFDHKGILVGFVYLLGELLGGTTGVFIIQTLFFAVTMFLCFACARKRSNAYVGLLTALAAAVYYRAAGGGEGLVEEYNLPFLVLAMYYLTEYLDHAESRRRHAPKYAFLYGLAFAASLCTRVTNGILLCVLVACIVVYLFVKKEFLNVLQNGVAFLAGFLLMVGPFCIYFAMQGALYDMWWGTVGFNLAYASEGTTHSLEEWISIGAYLLPLLLYILYAVKKNVLCKVAVTISSLAAAYYLASSYYYEHYYVIIISVFPIVVPALLSSCKGLAESRACRQKLLLFLLLLVVPNWSNQLLYNVKGTISGYECSAFGTAAIEQAALIPEEDLDSVLAYNVDGAWYLSTGISPSFKYCVLQDWQSSHSDIMLEENLQYYEGEPAKWLIVKGWIQLDEISAVVEARYEVVDVVQYGTGEKEVLTLYQRVD